MIAEILLAASLATAPPPAFCSIGFVRDDGKAEEVHPESARVWLDESIPMPVDFVQGMPVIVRARALREVPRLRGDDAGRGAPPTSIQFLVTEVLRGGPLPDTLRFAGLIDERDHFNPGPVPYRRGREDLAGRCHAHNYKTGAEYLLFLANTEFRLHLYHTLFSPVNEQLRGPDDPWLLWVREQVAADTVRTPAPGSAERAAILEALRTEMRRFDRRPVEFVVRHLRVQSGWAWLTVDPQSPGGRSRYEREAALLVRRRWSGTAPGSRTC